MQRQMAEAEAAAEAEADADAGLAYHLLIKSFSLILKVLFFMLGALAALWILLQSPYL
jgi:hypothetical protein